MQPGEFVSIVDPSGSGKSTLLHLLGALDRPSTGTVAFSGRDVEGLSDAELAVLRNREIGFVFQQFQLLARTPAWQNVALPLVYRGVAASERRRLASEALAAVGRNLDPEVAAASSRRIRIRDGCIHGEVAA